MSVDINQLVQAYLGLRDQKALLEAEHKAKVGEINAQMGNAEKFLLHHMNSTNQKNAGFTAGTVIVAEKMYPAFADKAVVMDYIKQTGAVELLQQRLSTTAVKEYMEANNQQLPPGVKVTTEREITIRRK